MSRFSFSESMGQPTHPPSDIKLLFAENLNSLLDERDAPARGYGRMRYLADTLGIGVSTAGKWLQGTSMPEIDRMSLLCQTLRCTFDDLLLTHSSLNEPPTLPPTLHALRAILSDFPQMASPSANIHLFETLADLDPSAALYLYKISSNIMEPFVVSGDWVAVRPSCSVADAAVYLLSARGELLLRRVQPQANGSLRLLAEHRRYQDELIPANEVGALTVVGVVTARILMGR